MPVATNWNQPSPIDNNVYVLSKKEAHFLLFLTIVDALISIPVFVFCILHFALEH